MKQTAATHPRHGAAPLIQFACERARQEQQNGENSPPPPRLPPSQTASPLRISLSPSFPLSDVYKVNLEPQHVSTSAQTCVLRYETRVGSRYAGQTEKSELIGVGSSLSDPDVSGGQNGQGDV